MTETCVYTGLPNAPSYNTSEETHIQGLERVGPFEFALVHGIRIPTWFVEPKLGENLERFQTRKDDVIIATYPKSGTTWVREILWQIYNGGSRSDENIRKRVFYLEATPLLPGESPGSLLPVMDLLPSPRLMFSHLPYHLIPGGKDDNSACKYIYLARNPKDVVVSLYHFLLSTRQLSGEDATALTWETFVDLFLQGKLHYNSWLDNVIGWWNQRHNPNVLFLKYEDMKKDLPSSVKAIAKFVGKPLTEEIVQRIARQCTFGEMIKHPTSYQIARDDNDNDSTASFLRKGVVGDWKNHLTTEMNEKFETKFIARMRARGLEFDS